MGQSSSKKQKKQKAKENSIARNANLRQSKNLNNKNENRQKATLDENSRVKNELQITEQKRNSSKECENKVNNNSIAANIKNVDPNDINAIQEVKKVEKDYRPIGLEGSPEPIEDDDIKKETSEIKMEIDVSSTDNSIIIHNNSADVEIRSKSHVCDETVPVKIVRSASTGGDIGHQPFRRLSARESMETRRRQFYKQMLNNTSSFDNNHVTTKYTVNDFPLIKRESLQSFYNHTSDIKEYPSGEYPEELRGFAEDLEIIENDLKELSKSQLTIQFPRMKDELHDNWKRVFLVRVTDNEARRKKLELITRVKIDLDILNNRYLDRKLLFVKQ